MAELAQAVYAKALFDAAAEAGRLNEVQEEVRGLCTAFEEAPQFLAMLASPALTPLEKQEILKSTLEARLSPMVYNFMRILSDKGRTPLFSKIAGIFYDLCRKEAGILLVTAVSAVPLSIAQQQKLCEKLAAATGKRIPLENPVDTSLGGGILLRYEGAEVDGSVKERLSSLRRRLQGVVV